MKLKKILSSVIAAAMVLSTASFNVLAADTDIIEVGVGKTYETWSSAINAADDKDGDGTITYHIYGKVDIDKTGWVSPRGKSGAVVINFVGMSEDAELCIPTNKSTVIATDGVNTMKEINFADLKCSRPSGAWVGDIGQANNYFTAWMRGGASGNKVTYTNCYFPDGACNNQYSITEFRNCDFENYANNSCLFVYGGTTLVDKCTFTGDKGIKIYSEDEYDDTVNTTITNSTFNNITKKPAIIQTQPGTVTIENIEVTDCPYGTLANEINQDPGKDPAPLGVATVDGEEPEYVAMVNGNLYTSVAYAEAESKGNTVEVPVAKVGSNKYYTSLEDALADAATDADTVILISDAEYTGTAKWDADVDLNGNTLDIKANSITPVGGVTVSNGTITITNIDAADEGIFATSHTAADRQSWTFSDVDFVASGVTGSAIFASVLYQPITINNKSTVTVSDSDFISGLFAVQNASASTVSPITINDTTMMLSNIKGNAFLSGATVSNSKVTMTNVEKGIRLGGFVTEMVINNTEMNIDGSVNAIKGDAGRVVTVKGNSVVKITNSSEYDISILDALNVRDTAKVYADKVSQVENVNVDDTAEYVSIANTIYVQFRNISTGDDYADKKNSVWEIVLVGANSETINELASVDLTFENNSKLAADSTKENPYTIAAKAGMTLSKKGDNRYMFSFDANTVEETDTEISLGTVTFGGYGALDFKVNASAVDEAGNASNVVNATELRDSIVETFVVGGANDSDNKTGELVINGEIADDDDMVGVIGGTSVEVPSRNLKINVTFPNAVDANVAAYQDMQVVISGGDITPATANTFKYALGEDMTTDDKYVVNAELTKGRTYTVTVSGAGYRTFAYDVTMDNAKDTVKELTFWNNVMDAPKVVEKDNDDSTETVTFLAGDIVKDDNINIYDLSAVVSYFATPTTTTGYDEKAQYDLNRDGMIDSKDVAYVLVSWGK